MNLQTFCLPMKLLKLMQSMNLQTPQQLKYTQLVSVSVTNKGK